MGYSLHQVQSPTWGWLGCSRARACCPSTCLLVTKFSKLPRNRAHTVSGILLRGGLHRSAWGCELQLLSLWGAPSRQWARMRVENTFCTLNLSSEISTPSPSSLWIADPLPRSGYYKYQCFFKQWVAENLELSISPCIFIYLLFVSCFLVNLKGVART